MKMARELSFVQSVERSISKTYRERLWTPFITAIKNYKLIEEGDKIAVCMAISGISTFPSNCWFSATM